MCKTRYENTEKTVIHAMQLASTASIDSVRRKQKKCNRVFKSFGCTVLFKSDANGVDITSIILNVMHHK